MRTQAAHRPTIDRQARDVLWREAFRYLEAGGFSDIALSMKKGQPDDAARCARPFRDLMDLLDDLGWSEEDPRDSYTLTLSAAAAERLFDRTLAQSLASTGEMSESLDPRARRRYPMTDKEWAEYVVETRGKLDHELDLQSICRALLREFATSEHVSGAGSPAVRSRSS